MLRLPTSSGPGGELLEGGPATLLKGDLLPLFGQHEIYQKSGGVRVGGWEDSASDETDFTGTNGSGKT